MRVVRICILLTVATRLLPAVVIEQSHWHDFAFTAQISGNPFDVDLRGVFTGPGGVQLVVPGFYDGENTWIIRFSPTAVGHWSMRTSSPAAALNGRLEANIECSANTNPAVHGGLLVDPVNRHHFLYEDGTRYFLMGYEADWLWAVDMKDPDRKVMRHLIDQIASRGFNHLIVNVFAYDTSWSKGKMNEWDYGPPEMFVFGGSNEKPDYSRLNPAFFKAYDGMMQALQDKGIVAHLMLKVYNKMVNWPTPGSEDEQRYFRYVTARYQAFSNVVWDFAKESYNEPDKKLQKRLTDLIRSTDGYHRLTTAHDNDIYDWNPGLNSNLDFRTDQEHKDWKEMLIFDRELRQWPVVNSELYYERGVDDLPSYPIKQDWQEMVHRGRAHAAVHSREHIGEATLTGQLAGAGPTRRQSGDLSGRAAGLCRPSGSGSRRNHHDPRGRLGAVRSGAPSCDRRAKVARAPLRRVTEGHEIGLEGPRNASRLSRNGKICE